MEQVDEALLRNILNAHSKTPRAALYLELGCLPIRWYIRRRRLNFLHEILNLDKKQLLSKFFKCQESSPYKGDWIVTIREDLQKLNIDMTFEQIQSMKKSKFKKFIKEKINNSAFQYLLGEKKEKNEKSYIQKIRNSTLLFI